MAECRLQVVEVAPTMNRRPTRRRASGNERRTNSDSLFEARNCSCINTFNCLSRSIRQVMAGSGMRCPSHTCTERPAVLRSRLRTSARARRQGALPKEHVHDALENVALKAPRKWSKNHTIFYCQARWRWHYVQAATRQPIHLAISTTPKLDSLCFRRPRRFFNCRQRRTFPTTLPAMPGKRKRISLFFNSVPYKMSGKGKGEHPAGCSSQNVPLHRRMRIRASAMSAKAKRDAALNAPLLPHR